jgi:hypothetical protein
MVPKIVKVWWDGEEGYVESADAHWDEIWEAEAGRW